MPRVWLSIYHDGTLEIFDEKPEVGPLTNSEPLAVDMNGSLYRQIVAANKKYEKFQSVLLKFYSEAMKHPGTVRRVR